MAILGELAHTYTCRRWSCRDGRMLALAVALLACTAVWAADAVPSAGAVASSPAVASEYQLKAVFLYNFTKYVDWPAAAFTDAQAPFVIGVLGDDPFGPLLDDTVRGEKVGGRPIVVRRYRQREEIKDCQVLFIGQNEATQWEQIFATLKGRSVLSVADTDKFTDLGGMIGLTMENNKIHIKINLDAAKAASLTISSNLLRVAEVSGHPKD